MTLDQGKSLTSLVPSDPRPIIDNGSSTGITVCGCGAGTISGLRLRSSGTGIELDGPATLEDNALEATGPDASLVMVETSSAAIDGNTFEGSGSANGFQLGVAADAPDPVVSDNSFSGLAGGVLVDKQPDKRSDDTTPTFKFSGDLPGSSFRCKLDGAQ